MSDIRLLMLGNLVMLGEELSANLGRSEGLVVVGRAWDDTTAMRLAAEIAPDVFLVDADMPGYCAVEVVRQVLAFQPAVKAIALSTSCAGDTLRLIQAGVQGYALKTMSAEDLAQLIRTVANGGAVLHPTVALRVVQHYRRLLEENHDNQSLKAWDPAVPQLLGAERELPDNHWRAAPVAADGHECHRWSLQERGRA